MSIASELTALQADITAARAAITTKGGSVTSGGGSSQLATDIATIPAGGGTALDDMADLVFWDMSGEPMATMTLAEMRAATSLPIPTGAQNTNTNIPIEKYGQLQYLIGTPQTRVETALNYYPNQNTKIEYCSKLSGIGAGSSTGINSYNGRNLYTLASGGVWQVYFGSSRTSTVAYNAGTMADDDFNTFVISKDEVTVNGVQYRGAASAVFQDTSPLLIGYTASSGKNHIKYIKIWESGVLLHNLVPVVKWEGAVIGFLDLVGDTFYPSASTSFSATTPNLYDMPAARTFTPSITEKGKATRAMTREGYTWLEWIESSGTQYIDMGLKGTQLTTISCIGMNTGASGACQLFGDNTTSSKAITCQTEQVSTAVTRFGAQSKTRNISLETMAKYSTSANGLKWGNNFEQWTSAVANFTTDGNLWLFGANGGTPVYSVCRIRECEVWNNGAQLRHFVAAQRDSDSAIGMYDLVNDVFYPNAGTGVFTAGGVITRTEEYTGDITKTWAGIPFFFEGWSWSLAQLKEQDTKMDVGSYWEPTDHKTHICVDIPDCDKTFELFWFATTQMNGYITIDWGDGNTSVQSGVTSNIAVSEKHSYASAGQYTIKVWSAYPTYTSNIAYFSRLGTTTAGKGFAGTFHPNSEKVKFVFFSGYMVKWGPYAIGELADTRLIGVSRLVTTNSSSLNNNADCFSLRHLLLPYDVIYSGNYTYAYYTAIRRICFTPTYTGGFGGAGGGSASSFAYNYNLSRLCLPKNAQICTSGTSAATVFSIPGLRYIVGGQMQFTSTGLFVWYQGCEELEEIRWPVGVTKLGNNFNKCYRLTEVEIPDTVYRIETSAFGNGTGGYLSSPVMTLDKLIFPASVQYLASRVFRSLVHIGEIHFRGLTPPTAENANTFEMLDVNTKIYVPYSADHSVLAAYKAATNWPSDATYTYLEEDE